MFPTRPPDASSRALPINSSSHSTASSTPPTIVTAVATCPPWQPQLTADFPEKGGEQVDTGPENPSSSISISTVLTADSEKRDSSSKGQTQQIIIPAAALWDRESVVRVSNHAFAQQPHTVRTAGRSHKNLVHARLALPVCQLLP